MIPTSVNNDGGINLNDAIPYAGFEQDSNPSAHLARCAAGVHGRPVPGWHQPAVTPIPAAF